MSAATPTKPRLTAQQAAERYVHPPSPADVAIVVNRALEAVDHVCSHRTTVTITAHSAPPYANQVASAAAKELEALGYKTDWRPAVVHTLGDLHISWAHLVKHPTSGDT